MGGGERNAAGDVKSGDAVAHSAPVLTKPTSPQHPVERRRLFPAQPKSGRGVGRSPTAVACSSELDTESLDKLIAFFQLLNDWQEASR